VASSCEAPHNLGVRSLLVLSLASLLVVGCNEHARRSTRPRVGEGKAAVHRYLVGRHVWEMSPIACGADRLDASALICAVDLKRVCGVYAVRRKRDLLRVTPAKHGLCAHVDEP
jgi:hypothetical protein